MNDGSDVGENGEGRLLRAFAPGASTFIDIGANVGEWAELFLQAMPPGGKGILFDPATSAVARLRERFASRAEIEIVDAAVSDAPGSMQFYEEPNAGVASSLVAGAAASSATAKTVTVTTLDIEAENRKLSQIDFVKIDAEGHDLNVLRGARGLLASRRIGVLQFEYHQPWAQAGNTLAAALSLLGSNDYSVFLVRADGVYNINYRRFGEYFSLSNYVGVSPQCMEKIRPLIRGTV